MSDIETRLLDDAARWQSDVDAAGGFGLLDAGTIPDPARPGHLLLDPSLGRPHPRRRTIAAVAGLAAAAAVVIPVALYASRDRHELGSQPAATTPGPGAGCVHGAVLSPAPTYPANASFPPSENATTAISESAARAAASQYTADPTALSANQITATEMSYTAAVAALDTAANPYVSPDRCVWLVKVNAPYPAAPPNNHFSVLLDEGSRALITLVAGGQ